MTTSTGTAANRVALLTAIKTFAVSIGWTQIEFVAQGTEQLCRLQAPGQGAGYEFVANLRTQWGGGTSTTYTIQSHLSLTATAGQVWGTESMASGNACVLLWDQNMPYWLYGNSRRIIAMVKVGSGYESMYLGNFLPWNLPSEYPFPLVNAGSSFGGSLAAAVSYTNTDFSHSFFVNPTSNSSGSGEAIDNHQFHFLTATLNWRWAVNAQWGSTVAFLTPASTVGIVHPYSVVNYLSALIPANSWNLNNMSGLGRLIPTAQGDRPLFPCELITYNDGSLGVLDGVYAVPGNALASEQIITVGARNFRAFQNALRTGGADFMCIEEI